MTQPQAQSASINQPLPNQVFTKPQQCNQETRLNITKSGFCNKQSHCTRTNPVRFEQWFLKGIVVTQEYLQPTAFQYCWHNMCVLLMYVFDICTHLCCLVAVAFIKCNYTLTTQPAVHQGVTDLKRKCACYVIQRLHSSNLETEHWQTPQHPVFVLICKEKNFNFKHKINRITIQCMATTTVTA